MLNKIFLFLFCLVINAVKAQDTLHVYFEFGKSTFEKSEKAKIDVLLRKYPLHIVDSVHFVGTSDSVGDVRANFKLSRKRAEKVYEVYKELFPKTVPCRAISRGEKLGSNLEKNRKVDIILFYEDDDNRNEAVEVKESDTLRKKEYCYKVNYNLLHRAKIEQFDKGNKKFVSVTVFPNTVTKKSELYTAGRNKKGKVVIKKIKWTKNTALIPYKDFQRYKILSRSEGSCTDSCSENLESEVLLNEEKCIQLDTMLMRRAQFKASFFSVKKYSMRAPKSFVDIDAKYFYTFCGDMYPFKWRKAKFFENKSYFYAKFPSRLFIGSKRDYRILPWNIVKEMDCCKFEKEDNRGCVNLNIILWYRKRGLRCINPGFNNHINSIVTGYNRFVNRNELFVVLERYQYSEVAEFILQLGVQNNFKFYSSFGYNYNFFMFPWESLNPFGGWDSGEMSGHMARMFIGTELRYADLDKNQNYLDQKVHLGIGNWGTPIQWNLQGGYAFDYLHHNSNQIYFIAQFQVRFVFHRTK